MRVHTERAWPVEGVEIPPAAWALFGCLCLGAVISWLLLCSSTSSSVGRVLGGEAKACRASVLGLAASSQA